MVRKINCGVTNLIGAARPSIADPFLLNKIKKCALKTFATVSDVTFVILVTASV